MRINAKNIHVFDEERSRPPMWGRSFAKGGTAPHITNRSFLIMYYRSILLKTLVFYISSFLNPDDSSKTLLPLVSSSSMNTTSPIFHTSMPAREQPAEVFPFLPAAICM